MITNLCQQIREIEDDVTSDSSEETIAMIKVWVKFATTRIAERLDVPIEKVKAVIRRMKK